VCVCVCVCVLLAEVGYEAFVRSGRHLKLHPASDKNSINNGTTVFTHPRCIPKKNVFLWYFKCVCSSSITFLLEMFILRPDRCLPRLPWSQLWLVGLDTWFVQTEGKSWLTDRLEVRTGWPTYLQVPICTISLKKYNINIVII